jgi:hypothetical protein
VQLDGRILGAQAPRGILAVARHKSGGFRQIGSRPPPLSAIQPETGSSPPQPVIRRAGITRPETAIRVCLDHTCIRHGPAPPAVLQMAARSCCDVSSCLCPNGTPRDVCGPY